MARGNERSVLRRIRATRSASLLPLIAAMMSAAALTGAAYYTMDRASCAEPAQYLRHDNHLELVGGCVNTADLPARRPSKPVLQPSEPGPATLPGSLEPGNYRP